MREIGKVWTRMNRGEALTEIRKFMKLITVDPFYCTSDDNKALYDAVNVAVSALSALPQPAGWISVEERLPKTHEWCIVAIKDLACGGWLLPRIAERRPGDSLWHLTDYDTDDWHKVNVESELKFKITHWMPLPESPERGEENE